MSDPESQDGESLAEPTQPQSKYDTVRASWPFSVDNIRASTPHFRPDDQADLISFFLWCVDPLHPLRREDAATRIGYSSNLIYVLLTGKYREPNPPVKSGEEKTLGALKQPSGEFMAEVRKFLKLEKTRYDAISTFFVTTPTAKKIFTACDLARESKTPVILFGPSHIGKTLALEHYQHNNNHGRTFMAKLDADCGRAGIIKILAEACGVAVGKDNKNDVVNRIKQALLAPDTILIIDEMHLLQRTFRQESFVKIIETIRRIHDFAKCGMVLCWSNLDDLKALSQDVLIQIWRRGVHKCGLPVMPTKSDLEAILKHHGLEFPKRELEIRIGNVTDCPYEILRQQSKINGLKSITERIRYAHKLAERAKGKIGWTHFVDAHLRIEKQAIQEGEWM